MSVIICCGRLISLHTCHKHRRRNKVKRPQWPRQQCLVCCHSGCVSASALFLGKTSLNTVEKFRRSLEVVFSDASAWNFIVKGSRKHIVVSDVTAANRFTTQIPPPPPFSSTQFSPAGPEACFHSCSSVASLPPPPPETWLTGQRENRRRMRPIQCQTVSAGGHHPSTPPSLQTIYLFINAPPPPHTIRTLAVG